MAIEARADASTDTIEEYRYLGPRPESGRRQLYIKGRRIAAGQLVRNMLVNGVSPEAAVEEYGLRAEEIREALRYYERHRDVIDQDFENERQYLHSIGLI